PWPRLRLRAKAPEVSGAHRGAIHRTRAPTQVGSAPRSSVHGPPGLAWEAPRSVGQQSAAARRQPPHLGGPAHSVDGAPRLAWEGPETVRDEPAPACEAPPHAVSRSEEHTSPVT